MRRNERSRKSGRKLDIIIQLIGCDFSDTDLCMYTMYSSVENRTLFYVTNFESSIIEHFVEVNSRNEVDMW